MASILTPGCERSSETAITSSDPASVSISMGADCALATVAAKTSATSARNCITTETIPRPALRPLSGLRCKGFRKNHDARFGVAKYLVENLVGGQLAFQKIDALGGDDEAAAIVLQHEALGAQVPQRKQQPFARKRYVVLNVHPYERGVVWVGAAFTVEKAEQPDTNLGLGIDPIGELFSQKDRQRPGRGHFELP